MTKLNNKILLSTVSTEPTVFGRNQKDGSFSYFLPVLLGASLLLAGCNEDGADPAPAPPPVIVTTTSTPPEPAPVTVAAPRSFASPAVTAAPAAAPVSNSVVSKKVSVMGGAISANSEYNFNITANDLSLPSWMTGYVGTDWVMDQFKDANLNSAVLHFNYSLDTVTDTLFRPNFVTDDLFLGSPTWETIEAGAIKAVNAGLKPVFYMTLNSLPNSWESPLADNYVPNNPDAFFASYKEQLLKIAGLSEKYGSPYMNIGTELGPVATDNKYLPYWTDIIASVREIYHGKLTYSSYVDDRHGFNTELDDLSFTNLIDMLGMNIYPQTLDEGQLNGTYDEFYNEWKTDIVPGLQSLIDKLGKPVFISEFGINRVDGTGSNGYWGSDVGMQLDYAEQAELLDAALRAIHEGLDIEGIVFWGSTDSTSIVNGTIDADNSYTTNWLEAPAELIVAKWADIFLPDSSGGSGTTVNAGTVDAGNSAAPTESFIKRWTDKLIPEVSASGGGGGYSPPSTESPTGRPGRNWYNDIYGEGNLF